MTPELLKKILDAIASGDEKAQAALLPEIVAALAGGAAPPSDNAETGLAENADAPPVDPNAPPEQASALSKALGFATDAEAAVEIKRLQDAVAKHTADTAAVELGARRDLVGELVKLGIEFPSTAFVGDPADRKICARLSAEPIPELRARVATLKQAKGAPLTPPVRKDPAAADGRTFTTSQGVVVTLSASEIKNCEASGAKLEAYAENKAIREAARTKVQK